MHETDKIERLVAATAAIQKGLPPIEGNMDITTICERLTDCADSLDRHADNEDRVRDTADFLRRTAQRIRDDAALADKIACITADHELDIIYRNFQDELK